MFPGLKPGLVEKFAAARTNAEKPSPHISVGIMCGLIGSYVLSLKVGLLEAIHHGSHAGECDGGQLLRRVSHSTIYQHLFWGVQCPVTQRVFWQCPGKQRKNLEEHGWNSPFVTLKRSTKALKPESGFMTP